MCLSNQETGTGIRRLQTTDWFKSLHRSKMWVVIQRPELCNIGPPPGGIIPGEFFALTWTETVPRLAGGHPCHLLQIKVSHGLLCCHFRQTTDVCRGQEKSPSAGWRPCRGKGWLYSACSLCCHLLTFLFHTMTMRRTGWNTRHPNVFLTYHEELIKNRSLPFK